MALLQISEPGQSPDPHQRRIAVGIDLGTTHSLVAAMRHGIRRMPARRRKAMLLPSAVRYLTAAPPDRRRRLARRPTTPRTPSSPVKRFMGRGWPTDIPAARSCRTASSTARHAWRWTRAMGEESPVEVSAEILASLRQRAEDSFDDELFGAVITVPAYFDDAQRQATKGRRRSWPA